MISILVPSRKRPVQFRRMVESAMEKATHPMAVEVVARFDEDDRESIREAGELGEQVHVIEGPRLRVMTIYWNECFKECVGDIVMQGNDDITFETRGWDVMVEEAFREVEDRILLVHGNDVAGHGGTFGPHPFVHRRWVEALGYFIPPYFVSDFGDAWVGELANYIGRRRFVPFDILHRHFGYGLAVMDETYRERLERHKEDDPDAVYQARVDERIRDVEKLRARMFSDPDTSKWLRGGGFSPRSVGRCPKCGSWSTVAVGTMVVCNGCGLERER